MNKPAFPRPYSEWHEDGMKHELPQQQGMSLLEYYAGQALAGYMAISEGTWFTGDEVNLFHIAEAMIKESEKRKETK